MSKSLRRVLRALEDASIETIVLEMPGETRTAEQAARAAGCHLDQIAKSVIFQIGSTGKVALFLTAGGNQVDDKKASAILNAPATKAEATLIRSTTGFAIGGVSPFGHVNQSSIYMDPRLMEFDEIWAAAGTPRHIFPLRPEEIVDNLSPQIIDFTS